jgi:hypothetical protein
MDFKIVLLSQDKTKTHVLDLYGDTDINIVFNIIDIREPELTKSNYTKEITIPATKDNNRFFESMLYNGFTPNNFNPNIKVNAQLYGDTTILIDGYLQIIDVIKNQNDIDAYKIIIYGEVASVFNSLTGLQLRDLDISEYNHIWNYTNIKNSWTNIIVNKGNVIQSTLGKGYVYPFEFRGQATTDMAVEDFYPAIYVKTIWDKIFKKAGKTYTSKFLGSEKFTRLIMPYTKSHLYLSDAEVKKREFLAHSSSNLALNAMPATLAKTSKLQLMTFNVEDADGNNLYDSKSVYTPKNKQDITLLSKLKLRMTYTANVSPGAQWKIAGTNITGRVFLYDLTLAKPIYSEDFQFVHNTGTILGPSTSIDIEVLMDYRFIAQANHKYSVYVDWTIPVGKYASKFITNTGAAVGGTMTLSQLANSTFYNTLEAKYIFEGDAVDMNQAIPEDININDFITSINKMFNLYWVANDSNNFTIEPRDDLYSSSDVTIRDWTQKTDRNSEILITPMSELNNKEYYFHYTPDDDYYNAKYTTSYVAEYGDRRVKVMNDFVTETSELKLIFSPSPLIQIKNSSRVGAAYVEDKDGYFQSYEPNIRIAIYGGLKSSSDYWLFKSVQSPSGVMQYNYPYAGHYDDPYTPKLDINWGTNKQYYYKWQNNCSNNLFNLYWRNSILDIIAPDSHMWKGSIHLRTFDMVTLNIFDTIQMDGVYYKINKLDYNPLTEIAYVELFKTTTFLANANILNVYTPPILNPVVPPTPGPTPPNPWNGGGWNPTIRYRDTIFFESTDFAAPWQNGEPDFGRISKTPYSSMNYSPAITTTSVIKQADSYGIGNTPIRNIHNNIYDASSFISVSGIDNNIAPESTSIRVMGNNNRVAQRASNISIVGNNNIVPAGLTNVSIVGDNVIARSSNTSYINGAVIRNGSLFEEFNFINGSVNQVQDPFQSAVKPNIIRGGFNAVQNIGGMTQINFVSGNEDVPINITINAY